MSPWTVINWETGETQPRVDFGPRIVGFLGYDPLPAPEALGQEVWQLRWRAGWTQRQLAARLKIDEITVRDWEVESADVVYELPVELAPAAVGPVVAGGKRDSVFHSFHGPGATG